MTLGSIFKRYSGRMSITLFVVLLEAALFVLFPLYIGFAIDGMLDGNLDKLIQLGLLGAAVTIIGGIRRFIDTRTYSKVYQDLSSELILQDTESTPSKLTARVNMLSELTRFLEMSLPEIVNSAIGLIGTLIILYGFSSNIFISCVVLVIAVILVFGLTSKRTMRYNTNYNNALESQVEMIEEKHPEKVKPFMGNLVKWNIKLSDLETINFSLLWLGMTALLMFSIWTMVQQGEVKVGAISSVVMYVFQFAEGAIGLPMFYQQWLRLKEISTRLKQTT